MAPFRPLIRINPVKAAVTETNAGHRAGQRLERTEACVKCTSRALRVKLTRRDVTGVMLSVARKRVRYHYQVFLAEGW